MTFNKKTIYITLTILALLLSTTTIYYYTHEITPTYSNTTSFCQQLAENTTDLTTKDIVIQTTDNNDIIFTVEIADTNHSRQTGLMCRKTLSKEQGMLFIFDDSKIRSFWMKNTLIPLDIIFIDENFDIINIHNNAIPLLEDTSYQSDLPAKYVLELKGGMSEAYNFNSSSKLIIN